MYGAVVCERIFDKAKELCNNFKENNNDSSYKSDEIKSRDKSNSNNKTWSSTKNSEDTGKFVGKNSTESRTRRAAYRKQKIKIEFQEVNNQLRSYSLTLLKETS